MTRVLFKRSCTFVRSWLVSNNITAGYLNIIKADPTFVASIFTGCLANYGISRMIPVRKRRAKSSVKKKILTPLPKHRIREKIVLAGLLIAGPAQANTYPNFTQGSMTSTTITETTVPINIEIEKTQVLIICQLLAST